MMKIAMEHRIIEHPRRAFRPGPRRAIALMSAKQHLPSQDALPRTRKPCHLCHTRTRKGAPSALHTCGEYSSIVCHTCNDLKLSLT